MFEASRVLDGTLASEHGLFAPTFGGVNQLQYDIDGIEAHARRLGFAVNRPSPNKVTVAILAEAVLVFENRLEDVDTVMGFLGTPWHDHDKAVLTLGGSRYDEFEPTRLLSALRSGDVVVIERFLNAKLEDRWIQHKLEPLSLSHVAEGEELRVHRLP